MANPKNDKQKMATITDIYHRIIWDNRLNRQMFVAGFYERNNDRLREKPLAEWQPNGDIPWHRVRYIRCGEVMIWDREKHLDLMSNNQLPEIAWKLNDQTNKAKNLANLLSNYKVNFSPASVYQYSDRKWRVLTKVSPKTNINNTFNIATYNVLCNLYETDKIQTKKRLPAIIEEIKNCNADIIALQEATPELIQLLLTEDWFKTYFISDNITAETISPYGILLLSKFPFNLVYYQFSAHKRVLVGSWQINNQLINIAAVHLTSNHAENATQKRHQQLATILAYLQDLPGDSLIIGDFNMRGNEQAEIINDSQFIDLWELLKPYENGHTFDPIHNPLAKIMTLTNQPERLDRILFKKSAYQEQNFLIPDNIKLFGQRSLPNTNGQLYPSDHFGLKASFIFDNHQKNPLDLTTIEPIYQSAIVIIPPPEILEKIQSIRRHHDRRFDRWLPHITLIYGFIPDRYFSLAVDLITPVLANIQPFQITLTDFQIFHHRNHITAWLNPETQPQNSLHQLQSTLQNLFPQCNEQSNKSGQGFTPHLTVGQFPNITAAKEQLPQWEQLSFSVNSVALISRQGNQPFTIKHLIPIGKNNLVSSTDVTLLSLINQLEPRLNQEQKEQRQIIKEIITQACQECLGFMPKIHLLGSARLGLENYDSDLDMVCLIPHYLAGEIFLARVQNCLTGLTEKSELVLNARVPLLRGQIDGISFDLLYSCVNIDNLPHNYQLSQLRQQNLDPTSQKAIIGCIEADLIKELVCQSVPWELFVDLLRVVKAYAKSRSIYSNSWGFLGGFSFLILTAWTCINQPINNPSLETLINNFFTTLSQYNWQNPLSLTTDGQQYKIELPKDILPIISSISPCQNTARNVTRSTAKILQDEFYRGYKITQKILNNQDNWSALFQNQEEHHTNTTLIIKINSDRPQELQKFYPLLESQIIGLLIQLEQIGVFVRPYPQTFYGTIPREISLGLNLPQSININDVEKVTINFLNSLTDRPNFLTIALNTAR